MSPPRCLVCGGPDAPVKELHIVDVGIWEYKYRFWLCQACHHAAMRQARITTMLKLRLAWQERINDPGRIPRNL